MMPLLSMWWFSFTFDIVSNTRLYN
jgi:hypothetical protein